MTGLLTKGLIIGTTAGFAYQWNKYNSDTLLKEKMNNMMLYNMPFGNRIAECATTDGFRDT